MKPMPRIIGLLLVLGLLGGIAYWDEWQTKEEAKEQEESSKVFSSLKTEDVKSIKIKSGLENYEMILEKQDDRWFITEPLPYLADQGAVNLYLGQIVDLKFEKSLAEDSSDRLKDFGLDDPEISVTLNDDAKLALALGLKAPVGYNRYLLSGNEGPVKLVGGHVSTALNKKIHEFRDKTIQMPSQNKLKQVFLINEEEISFERVEDQWELTNEKQIDEDAFTEFMGYWRNNVIEEFIDQPSQELGAAIRVNVPGTEFIGTLRWVDQENNEVNWQFFENNESLYGRKVGSPSLFKLSEDTKIQLQKTLWDFQYKKVVDINSTDVEKVSINGQVFTKKDDQWLSMDGSTKDFISDMLLDIEYASALKVWSADELKLREDHLKFSIILEMKNNAQVEFAVYEDQDNAGSYLVRPKSYSQVFEVDSSFIENFSEQQLAKSEDDDSQG